MEFAYYNPSDESRSCVVRTMTKLTGKAYQTVKEELTALAAALGYPEYNEPAVFERYMAAHGIFRCMEDCGMQVNALSLGSGTFCVFSTNRTGFFHLFPVIDGVIYDRKNAYQELDVLAVYEKAANHTEVEL